jgi:hypothetical protein
MQMHNTIHLADLIGNQAIKFSISNVTYQSNYFVVAISVLNDFSACLGVYHVKLTAKQLAEILKNSLHKLPLRAELFDGSVLVSQLISGVV